MLSVLSSRRPVVAITLFPVLWCWCPLLLCYFCIMRSVPGMDLQLAFVSFSQSLSVVFLYIQGSFFFNILRNRSVCSENFCRSFAIYCIAPRNEFISFVCAGGFNFSMASTFSSFGLIPFSPISCPNHFIRFMKNSDFFTCSVTGFFQFVQNVK